MIHVVYLNEDIKLGKKGVNYVTTIVDECMCSFHKIEQENDVGIDGQIELFDERRLPIGKLISVQVKTGRSYYDLDKDECYIPIGTHREYWMKIEMPVIGVVCVMDEKYESVKTAFWVDIKEYLLKNPTASRVKFNMSIHNELSKEKFRKYFFFLVCEKAPCIDFNEALLLLDGNTVDKALAMDMLLIFFSQKLKTWEKAFELYDKRDAIVDYANFMGAISYAYYHPDHWLTKGRHEFSEESKKYVQQKVKMFSKEDIINVLSIIEEHYFDRGSLGQTAEIIIKNVSDSENKLLHIILNSEIDEDMRYDAELILAYQNKEYYMQNIKEITCMDSECTELIVKYINDFGYFDLY